TRSPVSTIRSASRSAAHSTPSRTARPPRDGTPRWKSERCTIVIRSSSAGSPSTGSSSTRNRGHPASNQPHAMQASPAAPSPTTTQAQVPRLRRLDPELLDDRIDRYDVALELQLGLVQPGRDSDQLREVDDRHAERAAGRLLELRLPRVERQVAERTGR